MIEDNLNIEFNGQTFGEARAFIMSNMRASKDISNYYKKLLLDNYGGYKIYGICCMDNGIKRQIYREVFRFDIY